MDFETPLPGVSVKDALIGEVLPTKGKLSRQYPPHTAGLVTLVPVSAPTPAGDGSARISHVGTRGCARKYAATRLGLDR